MSNDTMLDIETLGTSVGSVVTQIGLRRFNRQTGELGVGLSVNISIKSCLSYGLTVDAGSLKFWFLQPQKTFLQEPLELPKALALVGGFLGKKDCVWCHSTFDIPVLQGAYNAVGQGIPWSFRNVRDIRTLCDLSGGGKRAKVEGDPKSHDALSDADYQIGYCVPMLQKVQGGAE